MFPLSARVLFPAVVSLISGLWAVAEWHAQRSVSAADADIDAAREAWDAGEARRAAADERAERKLRLAEAREARLAGKAVPPAAPGGEADQ